METTLGYRVGKSYPLVPWVHKVTTIIRGPGIEIIDMIIDEDKIQSFELHHQRHVLIYNRNRDQNGLFIHNFDNGKFEFLDSRLNIGMLFDIRESMRLVFDGLVVIQKISDNLASQIREIIDKGGRAQYFPAIVETNNDHSD